MRSWTFEVPVRLNHLSLYPNKLIRLCKDAFNLETNLDLFLWEVNIIWLDISKVFVHKLELFTSSPLLLTMHLLINWIEVITAFSM